VFIYNGSDLLEKSTSWKMMWTKYNAVAFGEKIMTEERHIYNKWTSMYVYNIVYLCVQYATIVKLREAAWILLMLLCIIMLRDKIIAAIYMFNIVRQEIFIQIWLNFHEIYFHSHRMRKIHLRVKYLLMSVLLRKWWRRNWNINTQDISCWFGEDFWEF